MTQAGGDDDGREALLALLLRAGLNPAHHDLDAMLAGYRGLQRLRARVHRAADGADDRTGDRP